MKVHCRHVWHPTTSLFQVTLYCIFQSWWGYYTALHTWITSLNSGSPFWFTLMEPSIRQLFFLKRLELTFQFQGKSIARQVKTLQCLDVNVLYPLHANHSRISAVANDCSFKISAQLSPSHSLAKDSANHAIVQYAAHQKVYNQFFT